MRIQIGSMLLLGVITVFGSAARRAVAQSATPSSTTGAIDFSLQYTALHSGDISGAGFWMQGGAFAIHGQVYRSFGLVADLTGDHTGNIASTGVGLNLITATFGPRFTCTHRQFAAFGQALIGGAHGSDGLFPTVSGTETKASSLAFQTGAGLNIQVKPHIAVRAVEVDWQRTQLPNASTNVQNNILIGAGLVFRVK
jgi:hypothetical protein